MKTKRITIGFIIILCMLCTACGSNQAAKDATTNSEENAKAIPEPSSTGHPNGEVQRICLMYGNQLYAYDAMGRVAMEESKIPSAYEGYEKVGEVDKIDNLHLPKEEFTASRIETGAAVYANKDRTDKVLIYFDGEVYGMIPMEPYE